MEGYASNFCFNILCPDSDFLIIQIAIILNTFFCVLNQSLRETSGYNVIYNSLRAQKVTCSSKDITFVKNPNDKAIHIYSAPCTTLIIEPGW